MIPEMRYVRIRILMSVNVCSHHFYLFVMSLVSHYLGLVV
uniref:Uncharacterized protein n=1 Tax=Utricularia reniformis TaxID=192314 RepID=A0A1Y0B1C1_9LAMI|nr:hypothetical protein AEK19_MT0962 [Utricularia reniformis]ART31187.1 hypothetical protein AEK19_MT0962 [Utricularia reniformis]